MLATALKPLARCPCHLCLVKKADIHLAGTKRDKKTRDQHPRTDSAETRRAIQDARRAIFKGRSIAGPVVKRHVDAQSMTAVQVRVSDCHSTYIYTHTISRAHSQHAWQIFLSTVMNYSRPTSCTSLNLACGRVYSSISCDCSKSRDHW